MSVATSNEKLGIQTFFLGLQILYPALQVNCQVSHASLVVMECSLIRCSNSETNPARRPGRFWLVTYWHSMLFLKQNPQRGNSLLQATFLWRHDWHL